MARSIVVSAFFVALTTTAAAPQSAPAPATVRLEMTQEQISATVNILHEYIKATGLAQPQQVRNATFLFEIFQAALKADADARAKVPPAAPAAPTAPAAPEAK